MGKIKPAKPLQSVRVVNSNHLKNNDHCTIDDAQLRYRLATQATKMGIWDWSPEDDSFILEHPYQDLPVLSQATDPQVSDFIKIVHPADQDALFEELMACRKNQIPSVSIEICILNTNQDPYWFLMRGAKASEHLESRIIGILLDITGRKKSESLLVEKEQQLLQAQKMEALGTLVAGVAHEINNPINMITFNAPLLQKIWSDILPVLQKSLGKDSSKKFGGLPFSFIDEKMGELLLEMDMAAKRIVRIVQSLKNFAKKEDVLDKSPVNLNDAVRNSIRIGKTFFYHKRIDLLLDLPDEFPLIQSNLMALEQIILNLLINAVQSISSEVGNIIIRTKVDHNQQECLLEIKDSGDGIDPEIREKIFDPFMSTRQVEGGTGLGLSVTYNLVKSLQGRISFESVVGEGTCFRIAFPMENKKPPYKILIADDEDSIRKLIRRMLEQESGFIIEEAANGVEACIQLGRFHPDLMILDIRMPQMDGVEVCRTIVRTPILKKTKVLVVTGYADDPELNEVRQLGFTDVMEKPIRIKQLVEIIKQIRGT